MKSFIKKNLIYLSLFLLLLCILDFVVFPNNNNEMYVKYNLIEKNKQYTEVLLLGNSHTFFGINPEKSSYKMINLANKGRKIETDYYLLKKNINKLKSLKYIIVPISHCKMHAISLSEQEKRLYYNYYKLKEYKQSFYKNSLILNEPFRELINDMFFKNDKISSLGWRANKKTYIRDTIAIKNRIKMSEQEFFSKREIFCDKSYIVKMNELCIDNKIKMMLLIPPYHPDYYEFSNVNYQKKITTQLFNLAKKEDMLFVNGRNLLIKDDFYFENSDHLNINGATIFTKKIDSILKLNE